MKTMNLIILGLSGLTLLIAILLHLCLGAVVFLNWIFASSKPGGLCKQYISSHAYNSASVSDKKAKILFGFIATLSVVAFLNHFLLLTKFSNGRSWLIDKFSSEPIFVAIKMTLDHYFSGHITLYDVVKDVFVHVLPPPMDFYFTEMSIHFLFEFLKRVNILVVNNKHDLYFEQILSGYAYLVQGIQDWEVLPTKMAFGNSIPYLIDLGLLNFFISHSLCRFIFTLLFNPNVLFVVLFAFLTTSLCFTIVMITMTRKVFQRTQGKKSACCPFCISLSACSLVSILLLLLTVIALADDVIPVLLGLEENVTFADYSLGLVEQIKMTLNEVAIFSPLETGVDTDGGKLFSHPYVVLDTNLIKNLMAAMNDACPTFGRYDYAQALPSRSSEWFMLSHNMLTADMLQCFCIPYEKHYVSAAEIEKKEFAGAIAFGYWWYGILMSLIEWDQNNLFVKNLLNAVFYVIDKVARALLLP